MLSKGLIDASRRMLAEFFSERFKDSVVILKDTQKVIAVLRMQNDEVKIVGNNIVIGRAIGMATSNGATESYTIENKNGEILCAGIIRLEVIADNPVQMDSLEIPVN